MNKKTHFGFQEVDEADKSKFVGDVFTSVAKNYDVMNDAMSFGMHRLWKKILVELASVGEKDVILDVASGTGDISKLISKEYPNTKVFMSDINYEMLDEAVYMIKNDLSIKLSNKNDFQSFIELIYNIDKKEKMKTELSYFIKSYSGSTKKIVKGLSI